jgi:WhiB family redox-sensing transcriptional regulator
MSNEWMNYSACLQHDPEMFFHEKPSLQEKAKVVCNTECPVRAKCLEWALSTREAHGVLGGLTPRERKTLLRIRGVNMPNMPSKMALKGLAAIDRGLSIENAARNVGMSVRNLYRWYERRENGDLDMAAL